MPPRLVAPTAEPSTTPLVQQRRSAIAVSSTTRRSAAMAIMLLDPLLLPALGSGVQSTIRLKDLRRPPLRSSTPRFGTTKHSAGTATRPPAACPLQEPGLVVGSQTIWAPSPTLIPV